MCRGTGLPTPWPRCLLCAGMNLNNMAKMLKCAANDDIITMMAEGNGDTVNFVFETPSKPGSGSKLLA